MSKKEKLLKKFLRFPPPNDFTFNELSTLLGYFDFEPIQIGKTGGSRVKFIQKKTKRIISLHKPHPGNILKTYILKDIKAKLIEYGCITKNSKT